LDLRKRKTVFMNTRLCTLLLLSSLLSFASCGTALKVQSSTVKDAEAGSKAAYANGPTYLKLKEVPNALVFLPAPPADGSPQFLADSLIYLQAKELRSTPRGQMAREDNDYSPAYFLKIFSEPMGIEMSEKRTPAIYHLVEIFARTIRLGATAPKKTYMRVRPFVRFGSSTITPEVDEYLATSGSYPSGHTIRGWGIALLLAEINPDAQDAILARGYEYGQSRVIGGYHYQSDVDAARLAASACYARMHSDKGFQRDFERAREEFRSMTD